MQIKYAFLVACVFLTLGANAQSAPVQVKMDTTDNEQIYTVFDERPMPEYDLGKYFGENIIYPDSARNNNIEGRVVVKFVVKKNGTISRCSVSQSVSWDLDKEALRVVCNMPPWKPGKIKGRAVKVWFQQPVRFKLE